MNMDFNTLKAIIDAYPYELVFVDRNHIVSFMNKAAEKRYGKAVKIGESIFNCHNEGSKIKIEEFLKRADAGEDEMFEALNMKKGEREFFVPVRDEEGKVIGYFERHEKYWTEETAKETVKPSPYIPY
ncbi:MAG: PAS domain-containing protein [Clostridia bacterium]|nr:PAS domain-containing protein [Clostridia bacterium]